MGGRVDECDFILWAKDGEREIWKGGKIRIGNWLA